MGTDAAIFAYFGRKWAEKPQKNVELRGKCRKKIKRRKQRCHIGKNAVKEVAKNREKRRRSAEKAQEAAKGGIIRQSYTGKRQNSAKSVGYGYNVPKTAGKIWSIRQNKMKIDGAIRQN